MKPKTKLTICIALAGLLVTAGVWYLLNRTSSTEKTVMITDYEGGVCTMDLPSSSCSGYKVFTQTPDGHKATYEIAGFNNHESKLYDELAGKLYEAKEQKAQVTIRANHKGEIISID